LSKDGKVEWKLKANSGALSVSTVPPGLMVTIDSKEVGAAPLKGRRLSPGIHTVEVADPCYYKAANRFSIKAGENKKLALKPAPRLGAILVTAEGAGGSAVRAKVMVDGKKLGVTPGTFPVSTCAKRLELVTGVESWATDLKIKEKQTVKIKAVMGGESTVEAAGGRKFFGVLPVSVHDLVKSVGYPHERC